MKARALHLVQIHYHLRSGGVRIVMENVIRAIRKAAPDLRLRATTITGSGSYLELPDTVREPGFEHRLVRIPALDYAKSGRVTKQQISSLVRQFQTAVPQVDYPTLVVGHNVTLGKNPQLAAAFESWARQSPETHFLSLIHDFPEDNRPESLKVLREAFGARHCSPILYPNLPNLTFGVINPRDLNAMLRAGVPRTKVQIIRNAVLADRFAPLTGSASAQARKKVLLLLPKSSQKKVLLYPIRIMRRKNVLEAVLLTRLLGSRQWQLWLALPPTSPAEISFWKVLWPHLKDCGVEIHAGFCGGPAEKACTLNDIYNSCDLIATTSVQEGFGFSFYEGWLAGKPVVGRAIADVLLGKRSICFGHLYENLEIPAEWIDHAKLDAARNRKQAALLQSGRQEEFLRKPQTIDFGLLDIQNQLAVLRRCASPGNLDRILRCNPDLRKKLSLWRRFPKQQVQKNADGVKREFALERIGRQWLALLRHRPMQPVPPDVHSRLLPIFLDHGLHVLDVE